MKYLNSLVFLGLLVMVAGCQKKEKVEPKKASHHTSAHNAKASKAGKQGPTKLETKKSVMHKNDGVKPEAKSAAVKKSDNKAKEVKAPKKNDVKKADPKKKKSDVKTQA